MTKYEAYADTIFTEEDIKLICSAEIVGKGKIFLSIALLPGGSIFIQMPRIPFDGGKSEDNHSRIRKALADVLGRQSGDIRIGNR